MKGTSLSQKQLSSKVASINDLKKIKSKTRMTLWSTFLYPCYSCCNDLFIFICLFILRLKYWYFRILFSQIGANLLTSQLSSSYTGLEKMVKMWQAASLTNVSAIKLLLCLMTNIKTSTADIMTSSVTSSIENVSLVIEQLLDGYDIRLRPQFGSKISKLYMGYIWRVNYVLFIYII